MSEENVEAVREAFDTFNAFMCGEMTEEAATQVAQRVLDPQFEYHWHSRLGMFPDEPQHLRGVPAFTAWWKQVRGAFVDLVTEPLEFIEAPDDRVLTPIHLTGRGRESGVPVEGRFFQVWTFRDGKLREVEFFLHRADALEAAGLREEAMSEENVKIVRQGYEDFNAFMRGELSSEALAERFDPQIEWDWHDERTIPDTPQHLRGAPDLIEFWEQFRGAWVDHATEPLEFIEAPDHRVLVSVRQSGRGRESGVPIVTHFFQLWTIRDGRGHKVELFRHRADALEAAGLRTQSSGP